MIDMVVGVCSLILVGAAFVGHMFAAVSTIEDL